MKKYQAIAQKLHTQDFSRVERDDRLLDILPSETRHYGIELWEKWDGSTVSLLRLRYPYGSKEPQKFKLPKKQIEQALHQNKTISL